MQTMKNLLRIDLQYATSLVATRKMRKVVDHKKTCPIQSVSWDNVNCTWKATKIKFVHLKESTYFAQKIKC